MELIRKPTIQEERLIEFLVKKSSITIPENWKDRLLVRPMDDGAMGSLYLFPQGKGIEGRVFGEQISDFQFTDLDGVEVIASLIVDNNGNLFELDIWKTDFGKLLKFPDL
jgi:hypothetical protein